MSAGLSMPEVTHQRSRTGRLITAVVTLAGALAVTIPAAAMAAPAPAPSSARLMQVGAAPVLPTGARALGMLPAGARVSGGVALKLPDSPALTNFIAAVSNPRSASYHQYLSRGQFAGRFGPSASAVAAVRRQLQSDGLTVSGVSANHLIVSFSGSAAAVEAAFHTGLRQVALKGGGSGLTTTSAVRLPASIAIDVTAVIGLNRLVREQSHATAAKPARAGTTATAATVTPAASGGGPVACADAAAQEQNGALTDQQVAKAYGLDPLYAAGDLAASQTVDIYELEPFAMSDIKTFTQCYFGADHSKQVTVTSVDGGPGTGPGSAEAALDVEDAVALAPGAKIHVFQGPNMDDPFGPLDTWNAIAVADDASQVSSSWGLCETEIQQGAPGVLQVENEIFQQMAAQGQTVFASAGDDGSDDCAGHGTTAVPANLSLDDPASQPYVTSVGGTTITNPASEPPVETVWNNGNNGGAGGGGISAVWAMQPWQDAVAVHQSTASQACSNDPAGTADDFHLAGIGTTLPAGTQCRETPEVSALADPQSGPTVFYAGFWTQIGGTSSSTPMWAAMLAEINGSAGCKTLAHGVGFADPLFYQVASASPTAYAQAFSDVTRGNNDNLGVGTGVAWPAAKGFDLATGLGTPRITDANGAPGLAAQLCAAAAGKTAPVPMVSSLTQLTGTTSIAGGGTVRINGANFGSAAGGVYFGNVRATVVSWSATAITVDVPAFYAPNSTAPGIAGRADVTVVTAAHRSSSPSAAAVYQYTANSAGAPVVDYVSSPNGPAAGGNTVHIIGAGLSGATSVHFGDAAAASFTVLSANEISVKVPASDSVCAVSASQGMCAVAVSVTTSSGTSTGPGILPAYQGPILFNAAGAFVPPAGCGCEIVPAPQEYDYAPKPTITAVSPAYAGEFGDTVVLTGSGFNLLTFEYANVGPAGQGFSQDFSVEGITSAHLTLDVPSAPELTVEPLAVPLSLVSAGQLSNVFKLMYAGTPVLTSISKHLADQANPGHLKITGHGLIDVTSVLFEVQGDLSFLISTSTAITNKTDTSLVVAIPQTFAFPTDVLACSESGCSQVDPKADTLVLTYAGRPVVTSSSPAAGPAHGGTMVTIQGALDSEVTAVDFGSVPAQLVSEPQASPSGPITVHAPPGKAGTRVNITITTLGGTLVGHPRSAVTKSATFTYKESTPSAPRHVTATAGVKSATVSWAAPVQNGGSPVTQYRIVASAKGHKDVIVKVGPRTGKVTVKLTPGVLWRFTVYARNKLGLGVPALSNEVRPKA
jgi:hypothetical protein